MDTKTIGPRWLVTEGLKIALILFVGFTIARVGADIQTAFPIYHPVVLELWNNVVSYATVLTAALYAVTRATLQATVLAKA